MPAPALAVPTQGHQPLDDHDGQIVQFGQTFYLYGTSYACGYEWVVLAPHGNPTWCGFVVQQSTDLIHWTNRHLLMDPGPMQAECASTGCFNVRVVPVAGRYVAWWSCGGRCRGHAYGVATADSPAGPFLQVEGGECCSTLKAVVSDAEPFVAGSVAYASTDDHDLAAHRSSSIIRRLTADGTAEVPGETVIQHPDQEEAQAIWERAGTWYLLLGTDCGYCSTGSTLRFYTAPEPTGPWADRGTLAGNACGGQIANVSPLSTRGGQMDLLQIDQWLHTANEAAADQRWGPLRYDPAGAIQPPDCSSSAFSLNS